MENVWKRFQNELRCRRRNRGESFRELAQDIRRIVILAYPDEQSSLSEHLARDTFLSALADPEFGIKLGSVNLLIWMMHSKLLRGMRSSRMLLTLQFHYGRG